MRRILLSLLLWSPLSWSSALFDGTNDQLRGTLTSQYGEPLTIAVKIKITDHPVADQTIFNIGDTNASLNDSYRCRTTGTDNQLAITSTDSGGTATSGSVVQFTDNTWISVICTITNDDSAGAGNARIVRVEGSSGNNDTTRAVAGTLDDIAIGESLADSLDFLGRIAEIAVWDVDLATGDEDAYVANNCTANIDPTNLIAYWPLVDDADDFANDGLDSGGDLTASGNAVIDSDHPTMGSCGGSVSFSSGPTEAPATNGFTISGTITGTGTLTVEAVACNPGDAVPSNSELEAGQCGGGNAALMNASEVWTTGVANDFLLTSTNKPVRFDVYVAGTNGTDDTAVTSLTDQDRSPRAGFAILALTSLSATSIFDCATCVNGGSGDAYFAPDVAIGDVIEYEDDTNEDADCNVTFEADGDFELVEVASGDCDGSRSFNISYQDVSSATDGLFNVGTFATDDTITNGNAVPIFTGESIAMLIALDENMTGIDLSLEWTDPEGSAVTVTATGLPTGLSVVSSVLDGTPTVCEVADVTFRGTDTAGNYAEVSGQIAIGPRMPDLVGMTEAEAIAAIAALCP